MKYDELMDKIEVTDAMRARILRNVSAAAPKKTPVRRYALLAACLAVVLLGLPALQQTPKPAEAPVVMDTRMVELAPPSPPPPPAPVPTLSEWSLMLLGLLAAGLGVRQVRRRT